jgi:hypothetical protein
LDSMGNRWFRVLLKISSYPIKWYVRSINVGNVSVINAFKLILRNIFFY